MDSKNEPFEVEFTDECIEEMTEIYEYISNNLKEDNVSKRLMTDVYRRTATIVENYFGGCSFYLKVRVATLNKT